MMDGEHETIYVSRAAAGLMLQVCPLFVCNISTLCVGARIVLDVACQGTVGTSGAQR